MTSTAASQKARYRAVSCKALFGGACDANRLLREQCLYLLYDFTRRRIPEAIRINYVSTINVDTEFTKSTPYGFYLRVIFFPQLCRHTGSDHLLDRSNRTVMDCYFLHGFILLFGSEPATPYKYFGLIQEIETALEGQQRRLSTRQTPATKHWA